MTRKAWRTLLVCCLFIVAIYFLMNNSKNSLSYVSSAPKSLSRGAKIASGITSYGASHQCRVTCQTGVPCEYPDEVAFRIIVLTYNRPESLRKCLEHIKSLDVLSDHVIVDVWIDRSKSGEVHQPTLDVAMWFIKAWMNGTGCVHVQERNAYVMGQWLFTWKPKPGTREIALILEDDIDISAHAYRWLKSVTSHYGDRTDISGYTLRMEDWSAFGDDKMVPFVGPRSDNVYAYPMMSTWGFSPHPQRWSEFQQWFTDIYPRHSLKPLIPHLFQNRWYEKFEAQGEEFENSMWEMWHHYYSYKNHLFGVFCNLIQHLNRKDVLLSTNRREKGLHFDGQNKVEHGHRLLRTWHDHFVKFPKTLKRYHYNNSLIAEHSEH